MPPASAPEDKKVVDMTYEEHNWSFEELGSKLEFQINPDEPHKYKGLSKDEAARRREKYGPNALTPPKVTPWYIKLFLKFVDPFMLLLELAALLCFILFGLQGDKVNLWIAIVLIAVVILTSVMSYLQEGQTAKIMNSFASMMSEQAKVRRNGEEFWVPSEDLVLGDMVLLESGSRVPADCRIVSSDSLKVENSSFTGEPEPVELCLEVTAKEALHSKNLAFNSAMVVEGKGYGIVVRTGDNTMIGSIASLAGGVGGGKSTLELEVIHFVHFITVFAIICAVTFYVIAGLRTKDWLTSFINVFIVIVVANVPEGLPATVTSCLTVCAQRLSKRNVFVKRLDCVETLGSITVVASDKTGTLTQNKMTVSHCWLDRRVRESDYLMREGDVDKSATLSELILAGGLCNMCKYEDTPNAVPVPLPAVTNTLRAATSNANTYTLSKKNRTILDQEAALTVGGSAVNPAGAAPSILTAGFFEKGEGGVEMASKTPTNAIANSATVNVPDIVRQMSALNHQGTVGRNAGTIGRNGGTIGRQGTHRGSVNIVPRPERKVTGNPSDLAIFNFCNTFKDIETMRAEYPQLYIVPFNSRLKWMKTIHAPPRKDHDQRRLAILKGAPEIVLKSCTHFVHRDEERPIDESFMKHFNEVYKEIAGMGERVLGFARLRLPTDTFPPEVDERYKQLEDQIPHAGYTFLGLISLIDPPKLGVPEAVLRCKNAGIRVIMITGDHPLTAEAISKKVNIIADYDLREAIAAEEGVDPSSIPESRVGAAVVECSTLANYTEDMWKTLLDKPELVFARASPKDKLVIVEHLQKRQDIVAVTGDGVNDSPALKQSDIGIAMGIMGTEVAKSAANVVLMDDDFCSIVNGIEEGRVLFDNLTKTIAYTLTHLVPELVSVVINIVANIPPGLSSLMILSIDLLTEVSPAISFAWEPAESNVMDRPPRDRKVDRLVRPQLLMYSYVQAGMIEAAACLIAYFAVFWEHGLQASDLPGFGDPKGGPKTCSDGKTWSWDEQHVLSESAMTAFYTTLILGQVFNVFNCKTRFVSIFEHGVFNNTLMNYGVLISMGIMFFFTYVPGFEMAFFTFNKQPAIAYVPFLLAAILLTAWNEGRKYIMRRAPESKFTQMFSW